jgi:uncharacterized protein
MRMVNGWAVLCLIAAGCLTVNVYFPAPEVRAAAEEIVHETWGDGSTGTAEPDDPQTSLWRRLLMPSAAYAADPDIDVSTAAIRQIKSEMSTRAAQLKPHLRSGALGIGSDGLLVVRDASALNLRDQAQVRRLVDAENRDRVQLYQEIARANDLESSAVKRIQEIFAETWIANAESGWWVQKGGTWSQK